MSHDNDRSDTLPAPHPDTPEWALQHYNLMLRVYQEIVDGGRSQDADRIRIDGHDRDIRDLSSRVSQLEGSGNGVSYMGNDDATNPGGE